MVENYEIKKLKITITILKPQDATLWSLFYPLA